MWVFRFVLGTHPFCRPAFEWLINFRSVNCHVRISGIDAVIWYERQPVQLAMLLQLIHRISSHDSGVSAQEQTGIPTTATWPDTDS